MKITQVMLNSLTEQAKASERLRMNLDLRNSDTDGSQRMLNAIEPGSILPIHRHQKLERICTDSFIIEPGGFNVAVSIPIGVWHTVHALESGTCILEMKNGAYEPLSDVDILK